MDLLIILVLCIMATAKVTLQGNFAKKHVKTSLDSVFFNGLIFFFSFLIFSFNIIGCSYVTFIYGGIFGLLTVLFQLLYISAMSMGNVSLTVMTVNLSMVIPILLSVFCYNEKLTWQKLIGIILTVLAIVMSADKKSELSGNFKKWFILSISASLTNGVMAVCQKVFTKTEFYHESQAFVAVSYLVAALFSLVLVLSLNPKSNLNLRFKVNVWGTALCIGLVLGLFQVLNTKAMTEISGVLFFPAYYGGSIILSGISGVLILKDKLKKNQVISMIIGITAIVLMNF